MSGRFLAGLSVGFFSIICPLYTGEIAPKEIRGALLGFFQIMLNFGVLFIMTLGYFVTKTTVNIVCATIPAVFALIFFFLPESPSMLLIKNREEEAIKVIKLLNGKYSDYLSEIDSLKNQNEEMMKNQKTFREVLSVKSTRKAFIIMMLNFFFFQMTAINIVLFYSTTIFAESGVDIDPGISSIIIGAISFLSSLLASMLIDKFGRRILLCFGYTFVFLSLCGIGTFFILQEFNISTEFLQWLPLTSLCIFVFSFNFGISPVAYALFGEIFVDEAKKFIAPICQGFNFTVTFIIGMTFPFLVNSIGLGFTFILFACITLFGLLYAIFIVPETKGKTREEIFKMLS